MTADPATLRDWLSRLASIEGVTDALLQAGQVALRKNGEWTAPEPIKPERVAGWLAGIVGGGAGAWDSDRSDEIDGVRFRLHAFRTRDEWALSVRRLAACVPEFETLGFRPGLKERLLARAGGLILVAGPTGSGKSTTLAALLTALAEARACHVMTIEDPVEYLILPGRGVVTQREVGRDVGGFAAGLRAALRCRPDVIMVGEMRDPDTIAIALQASETGHLGLSTTHRAGVVDTVHRIVNAFSPDQVPWVRAQLAGTLQAILTQRLLSVHGRGHLLYEALFSSPAVRAKIAAGLDVQLVHEIHAQRYETFNDQIRELVRRKVIPWELARELAPEPERLTEGPR